MPQVDTGDVCDEHIIKKILRQSGLSRKQFYASTKGTAKKINVRPATKEELATWADS